MPEINKEMVSEMELKGKDTPARAATMSKLLLLSPSIGVYSYGKNLLLIGT